MSKTKQRLVSKQSKKEKCSEKIGFKITYPSIVLDEEILSLNTDNINIFNDKFEEYIFLPKKYGFSKDGLTEVLVIDKAHKKASRIWIRCIDEDTQKMQIIWLGGNKIVFDKGVIICAYIDKEKFVKTRILPGYENSFDFIFSDGENTMSSLPFEIIWD